MPDNPFKIKNRFRSFKYAFEGLIYLFKKEHNSWIHALAMLVVIVAGCIFKLNTIEWLFVIIAVGLVFAAELINSSIERLVDLASPDINPIAKQAKDLAAAAVLVVAIVALLIGLMIFVPKIKSRVESNKEKELVYEKKNISENIKHCSCRVKCHALSFGQYNSKS